MSSHNLPTKSIREHPDLFPEISVSGGCCRKRVLVLEEIEEKIEELKKKLENFEKNLAPGTE